MIQAWRYLICMAACFIMLSAPYTAGAKPPPGITINVEIGYDGWIQPSRVNPVIVNMENSSTALNLSGDLVLSYNGVEYSTRLELPAPSKKRFYLYFPCDNWPPYLQLRVRTKQYTEQFDLTQAYKAMQPSDASALVLTQQSGSLGAINQLSTSRLERDLYRNETAELETGKLFVSYFDIADIDPTPKFFSRADLIVLADIDYQQVTPQLAEALKAFITGGGSLVFSLGLNGASVSSSPLASLCPIAVTGTTQISNLGDFGRLYRITAGSPATLAIGPIAPDAEILRRAGTIPTVVRMTHGSGMVTALAFDFTQAPFKGSPALARVFADSALQIRNSVDVTNWFVHPQYISTILKQLSEAVPMRPMFVFLFLSVYILLIGPVNFLILSRMKRRTLVWTTIPLIILGFSWFGLETGRLYRGNNNVCAYVQEMHVFPDSSYTPYQTVMLVFTAERNSYKLTVPDASAFLYPEIPAVIPDFAFGGGNTGAAGMRGLSNSRIDNSTLPTVSTTQGKWTSKEYFYQGYLNAGTSITADIEAQRRDGRIESASGTYTLDLPFDLYHCYVQGPSGGIERQGFIEGKGTHHLHWNGGASPDKSIPGQDEDYLLAKIEQIAQRQRECSEVGLRYRDELLLVGFTNQVEALAKFDRPHKEHLLTMVVVHLPYKAVIPQDGKPARNIRGLIIGGSDFELRDNSYAQQMSSQNERRYTMKNGAYMDVQYEVSGELSAGGQLLLHLRGYELKKEEPVPDLAYLLSVSAWDGHQWISVNVPRDDTAMNVPLARIVGKDRRVTLRLRAKTDFVLEVPAADAY